MARRTSLVLGTPALYCCWCLFSRRHVPKETMNRIEKKRPARPSRKTPTLAAAPGTVTTAVQQYRPADQRQIQATPPNNSTAGPPEKNEATCAYACGCACGWKIGTNDPDFLFAERRRRSNAGSKSKTDNHQRLGNRSQARLDLSKNLAGSQVKSGGGDRQARGAIPFLLTFSFRIDRSDSSPLGLVTAVLIFQARHFFSSTSRAGCTC